jgi:hypothetical protein
MADTLGKSFDSKLLATEGEKVPVWLARPFQLASLLEMLKKYGHAFYKTGQILAWISGIIRGSGDALDSSIDDDLLDDENRQHLIDNLKAMLSYCEAAELEMSAKGIKSILTWPAGDFTFGHLRARLPELERRFLDELESVRFMHIPEDKVMHYESSALFGDQVAKKFARSITDIQEA